MRKVAKVTLYSVCLAVLLWFFLSWLDIVADNCEPNPHHSPYNVFVLMTQQEEKTEEPTAIEGTCGSPLTDQTRLATAHKYFKRPFSIDEMDDAEAEMYGYDTY